MLEALSTLLLLEAALLSHLGKGITVVSRCLKVALCQSIHVVLVYPWLFFVRRVEVYEDEAFAELRVLFWLQLLPLFVFFTDIHQLIKLLHPLLDSILIVGLVSFA